MRKTCSSGNGLGRWSVSRHGQHQRRRRGLRAAGRGPAEVLEGRLLMARDLYVDGGSPGPVRDGASWASAYADLQLALAAATAGDRILVADGTYKPTATTDRTISFALKNGVSILGGYAGYGAAEPEARDAVLYPTILSGEIGVAGSSTDNSIHVVVAIGVGSSACLDGFTITAGYSGVGTVADLGAGMYNESSSPTLVNCSFIGNLAGLNGGGMYNGDSSSPILTNCSFSDNSAYSGGGMYNGGSSSPILTNCSFSDNSAGNSGGGMDGGGSPTLINCSFSGNSAGNSGGGMDSSGGSPTLINCSFSGNSADTGGGMYSHIGSPTLTNCSFIRNSAYYDGGGMFMHISSPRLVSCSFNGNSAGDGGGGMAIIGGSSTLTNCSFVGNLGGGMYNSSTGPSILTNCTFAANSGTGLSNSSNTSVGMPKLTNVIIWGSGIAAISNVNPNYPPVVSYSDIQGGYSGTGNLNADPKFLRNPSAGADGTWGTADDDYGDLRLQPTSPCIDKGKSNASGLSGITTDLAGGPRFTGAAVDIGAYELDFAPTLNSVLINDGAAQRSMVRKVSVVFSEPVTLSADALTVKLASGQAVPNTTLSVTNPSGDRKSYVLSFSGSGAVGGSLADGIYDLGVWAGGVQDSTGNALTANYTQRFHRLFGDSDGNKVVNALDYARLKNTFARSSSDPLFNSAFDYEGNGLINALDLARFRQRYGLVYSY